MLNRPQNRIRRVAALTLGALLLASLLSLSAAPPSASFRFAILGDRTGEAQPGVYEQAWKEIAADDPAFVISVGDTIQGMDNSTAEAEWREVDRILEPYRGYPVYLVPGNHDIWSAESELLFREHAAHGVHYSFDYGPAHFTVLDNSRSEELPTQELALLETDLKAHTAQPLKLVFSHRPSWLVNVALGNPKFALHQLARQYGIQYVIAGHVHQMLRFALDGVIYVSAPSSGGHLRSSRAYEDGWFFGYVLAEVRGENIELQVRELGSPHGEGRTTKLADWGMAGLVKRNQPEPAPAK